MSLISTTAYVDTSISACKCYSSTFECNTNALGPDDTLGICIKQMPSFSADIELHDITNLSIDQANSNKSLQIIQDHQPVNSDLSEITDAGDVYFINTVVPARFFKSVDSISVSGIVQVQFKSGARRQLYVNYVDTDTIVQSTEEDRGMSNNFGFRVGLIKPITTIPRQKVAASYSYMMGTGTSHILGALCFFWTLCRGW